MVKKKYSGVGVGSTSIIMIFVVLCLTAFSILSFSSSDVGNKMANKTKEQTIHFYEAENKATLTLQNIDEVLFSAASNPAERDGVIISLSNIYGVKVFKQADYLTVSYDVPITETRYLAVELKVPLDLSQGGKRYEITKWSSASDLY